MSDEINVPDIIGSLPSQDDGSVPVDQFKEDSASATQGIPIDQFKEDVPPEGSVPLDQFKEDPQGQDLGSLAAAGIGGAQGVAGPLATAGLLAAGMAPEDIRATQAAHPYISGGSELATGIGSLAVGIGELSAAAKAGEAVATAAGLSSATGATALKWLTEAGILTSGNLTTNALLKDPDTSIQTAMIDIPFSMALGALGGATFAKVSPLWRSAWGTKLPQALEDMKGEITFQNGAKAPAEAMSDEMDAYVNELKTQAKAVYGPDGLKTKQIIENLPDNMTQEISDSTENLIDKVRGLVKENPNNSSFRDVGTYLDGFEGKVKAPEPTVPVPKEAGNYNIISNPEEVFNQTNRFKQQIAEWGNPGADLDKYSLDDQNFIKKMRALGSDFKSSLEDNDVWGEAGNVQKKFNEDYSALKGPLDLYTQKFTRYAPDESGKLIRTSNPTPFQTFLNQRAKPSSKITRTILNSVIDQGKDFQQTVENAAVKAGVPSPFTNSSLTATEHALGNVTPGMKWGQWLYNVGAGKIGAKVAGTVTGGVAGAFVSPAAAYVASNIGKEALGPMFADILPSLAQPLFEKLSSAQGLKSAAQFGESALNGQKSLEKGTKSIFSGKEVLPLSKIPSSSSIIGLDHALANSQEHPEQTTAQAQNTNLGHYLPQHAESYSQMVGNNIGYLNQLRPQTQPAAPLDANRVPSSDELASYHNALSIAQQPMVVLHKLQKGTIVPDDIKHLNNMYPALWEHMKSQLAQSMNDHLSKGNKIDYKTKMGISMFTGQDMDSTLTPQSILAAQPQVPSAQPPKQGNKKSTAKLSEIATVHQTQLQASQKEKVTQE